MLIRSIINNIKRQISEFPWQLDLFSGTNRTHIGRGLLVHPAIAVSSWGFYAVTKTTNTNNGLDNYCIKDVKYGRITLTIGDIADEANFFILSQLKLNTLIILMKDNNNKTQFWISMKKIKQISLYWMKNLKKQINNRFKFNKNIIYY